MKTVALIIALISNFAVSELRGDNPIDSPTYRLLPLGVDDPKGEWQIFRDSFDENTFYFAPKIIYVGDQSIFPRGLGVGSCEVARTVEETLKMVYESILDLAKMDAVLANLAKQKAELTLQKIKLDAEIANRASEEFVQAREKINAQEDQINGQMVKLLDEKRGSGKFDGKLADLETSISDRLNDLYSRRESFLVTAGTLDVRLHLPHFDAKNTAWLGQYGLDANARVLIPPYMELSLDPSSNPRTPGTANSVARAFAEWGSHLPEWSEEERPTQGLLSVGVDAQAYRNLRRWNFRSDIRYTRDLSLLEYCRFEAIREQPQRGDLTLKITKSPAEAFRIKYSIGVFLDSGIGIPNGSTLMDIRLTILNEERDFLSAYTEPSKGRATATHLDAGHPLRFSGRGQYVRETISTLIKMAP